VTRLLEEGCNHMARQNFAAAVAVLARAVAADPLHAESHNRHSTALFMAGDMLASAEVAKRVLQLEPRYVLFLALSLRQL
jgi:Flp pilus assembly protein TadD